MTKEKILELVRANNIKIELLKVQNEQLLELVRGDKNGNSKSK